MLYVLSLCILEDPPTVSISHLFCKSTSQIMEKTPSNADHFIVYCINKQSVYMFTYANGCPHQRHTNPELHSMQRTPTQNAGHQPSWLVLPTKPRRDSPCLEVHNTVLIHPRKASLHRSIGQANPIRPDISTWEYQRPFPHQM